MLWLLCDNNTVSDVRTRFRIFLLVPFAAFNHLFSSAICTLDDQSKEFVGLFIDVGHRSRYRFHIVGSW